MKSRLNVGPLELKYTVEGSGRPAIVIGSSIYYARTFSQNLRKHLQFIFMDHRGFVATTAPLQKSEYELDVILDDIEQLRLKLSLEEVIIVGHSGHGFMALEYAKKYPNHVSHVVLLGMQPNHSAESFSQAEHYFNDTVCAERKSVLAADLAQVLDDATAAPDKRFIAGCLRLKARTWYDFHFDPRALWEGIEVNMPVIDYLWGEVFRDIDITKGLEHFYKPVFLGLGLYDYLIAPFYVWNSFRSYFKNLTVRLFDKSGHTPQYEQPEVFDAELLRWLS